MNALVITLRRAYRESGMTLAQIAARSEVAENTVYAILAGRNVRTVSLFAVCQVLGVETVPVPARQSSATSCEI